ncbi:XRE family transcriptional regulator, partial [Burkholderia sp. TJI49]
MTETAQLIDTLKRLLKAQGMTYRDVARALDVSET